MTRPQSYPLPVIALGAGPLSGERPPFVDPLPVLLDSADRPQVHSLDDGPGSKEAGDVLMQVLEGLRRYRPGREPVVHSLKGLSADALERLTETLAEGEVSLTVTGSHVFKIAETALPGVWRVRDEDASGQLLGDFLEVADVPSVVRAANEQATCRELSIGAPPEGAMNVLPLLAELRHRMKTWQRGQPNHVVSFTLLPMSDVDMRFAEAQLKHGPVRAESKGHGRCVIELTGHHNLWSVQYFNNMGAVILDTIEVGDAPAALVAGREDFEDSAQRLAEVLGV
jgi:hydrogenase-1 operon protein HyaF